MLSPSPGAPTRRKSSRSDCASAGPVLPEDMIMISANWNTDTSISESKIYNDTIAVSNPKHFLQFVREALVELELAVFRSGSDAATQTHKTHVLGANGVRARRTRRHQCVGGARPIRCVALELANRLLCEILQQKECNCNRISPH